MDRELQNAFPVDLCFLDEGGFSGMSLFVLNSKVGLGGGPGYLELE